MRALMVMFLAALAVSAPALAQPSRMDLRGDPVPIVEVTINRQTVRLEIDFALPDIVVFNPATAERLGVRPVPFTRANVVMEDAQITGRVARPRITFADGERARAFAGIFAVPATSRADGIIGPGVLPHEIVHIAFGQVAGPMRTLVFELENPDVWRLNRTIAPGTDAIVNFTLSRPYTLLNRPAANALEAQRLLEPVGELQPREFILGLSSLMQPVEVDPTVTIEGLTYAQTLARTANPIIGADEETAIFVQADSDRAPPLRVTLGAEALANCAAFTLDRRARTLTMHCAAPSH